MNPADEVLGWPYIAGCICTAAVLLFFIVKTARNAERKHEANPNTEAGHPYLDAMENPEVPKDTP